MSPSLFKSNQALIDSAEQSLILHYLFLMKSCPLVIHLVNIWDSLRPQILQKPLIILTNFLVLGFTFSYSISFSVSF